MSIKRIAAVTDDGLILSNHFGMTKKYLVGEIGDGRILSQKTRAKPHHNVHPDHSQAHSQSERMHEDMFAPICDYQILLVGGLGRGAYQKALSAGLEVELTGGTFTDILQAYLSSQYISSELRTHRY